MIMFLIPVSLFGTQNGNLEMGLSCSHCKTRLSPGRVMNHLTLVIQKHVRKYYAVGVYI